MKVLLVATNRERSPYPVAPLGALCVAAAARAAGHEVKFLDLGMARMPQRALRKALAADKFQAVAFGIRNLDNCWSFAPRLYFNEVRESVETVRQHFDGPLILGGSGFSVSPQGWMRRLQPDCGVVGEGERAFPEALARLETGRSLEGIEGVITNVTPGAADLSASKPNGDVRSNALIASIPNWKDAAIGFARPKRWLKKSKPWLRGRRCGISFSWTAFSTIPGTTRWRSAKNSGGGAHRPDGRPSATRRVSTRNSRTQ
jgi:hypothetical protein